MRVRERERYLCLEGATSFHIIYFSSNFKVLIEIIVGISVHFSKTVLVFLEGRFKAWLGSQMVNVLGLTLAMVFACCGPLSYIWFRIGTRKAAVFPEPVWAQAMRSRRAIMMGIAYFCTGVGLSYRANAILLEIISVICTSSNLKQKRKHISTVVYQCLGGGGSTWHRIYTNLSCVSF